MSDNGTGGAFDAFSKPLVKNVRWETEIRWVSRLDASFYGAESVDHEGLCGWWRAYPKGIHALWKNNRLIGAIGIWPVKKESYERLVAGEMDETDIKADDIWEGEPGGTHAYWYFADIVLEEKHQKTRERLAVLLIEESIRRWLGRGNLPPQIHACALGFAGEGVSILETFKFTSPGGGPVTSPAGKPVYARTLMTYEALEELDYVSHLRKRRREREAGAAAVKQHYDVFISYRREYADLARLIHNELEEMSYGAFLDAADLCSGPFDKALYDNIRNTPNFVVILSPGCLERCTEGEDYFLREIAHALKTGRKMIPVKMTSFDFPDAGELPADLRDLPLQQHVPYAPEYPQYADKMIEIIVEYIER